MRSHNRQGKPNIFFNRKTASYLRWMFTLSFVGLAFRFQSSHYLGYWKYCCKRLGVLHYCGTWNQIRVLHVILLHSFSDKTANKKYFLQCSLYFNFRNHLKQRMNEEIMSTFYLVKQFLTNYTSVEKLHFLFVMSPLKKGYNGLGLCRLVTAPRCIPLPWLPYLHLLHYEKPRFHMCWNYQVYQLPQIRFWNRRNRIHFLGCFGYQFLRSGGW